MSNALAIAAVTATLAQIVRTAAQEAVGGADVVFGRPESAGGGNALRKVHLYLYQVTPNAAWRNADLPTRGPDGTLRQRPQAALDLHYLLTFYGNESELEPQRLLGAVVRDLHARPVLTRQLIRDAIAGQPYLAQSDLAEAVEQIKFSPLNLTLDELSKLWSVFFQTPHALSVAYQGTVVLIESEERPATVLPVLQRGPGDRGVETLLGPFPLLETLHIGVPEEADLQPRPPSYPGAQLGLLLTLTGRNLGGTAARVRFSHPRLPVQEITVAERDRSATSLQLVFPDDATAQTAWAAGLYSVTALIGGPGDTWRATNALALPFAPQITSILPGRTLTRDGNGDVTLTLQCRPQLLPEQNATLLLVDREVPAEPHPNATDTVTFVIKQAPVVKDCLIWLRVDGVNSLPIKRQGTPPGFVFADDQRITLS